MILIDAWCSSMRRCGDKRAHWLIPHMRCDQGWERWQSTSKQVVETLPWVPSSKSPLPMNTGVSQQVGMKHKCIDLRYAA